MEDALMIADFLLANRPLWAVLISLIAAGLILVTDRRPNLREGVTLLAAAGKFTIILTMLPAVLAGQVIEAAPLNLAPGIALHLRADAFGLLFALLSSFLWILTSVYNIGYMRSLKYGHQSGYYACFALCLSATIGIALAANLLTFFVFYEILTVATYPLVVHDRTPEAIDGGRKYLVYTLTAGQLLLVAVIWTQFIAPGAEFQPGGFVAGKGSVAVLQAIFILFILGLGVKAAIMPLHDWLPTAMVAPTPVSALLHAVAVVKAGAFGFLRISGYVFGPQVIRQIGVGTLLAWIAAITIILASVRALSEDGLKRRLAYSTVGQLSYVVLGAAIATPMALIGGMFHIVAHAFMKITLFFCAGAIYATTHKQNVSEMKGIGRQMPVTMAAFTVGSLAIVGTPFMVGFISKWNLGSGAVQAQQWVFIAVLVVSALLTTGYFFPIVYNAYFGRSSESVTRHEARKSLLYPLVITALASVVLGIVPSFGLNFYELATMAVKSIFAAGTGLAGGGQ
jgi:multicomponent Na+:H+ antiporter subunit D